MLLSDIILQSCEAALQLQSEDGSFPPGCNGPYHDPETPVRMDSFDANQKAMRAVKKDIVESKNELTKL